MVYSNCPKCEGPISPVSFRSANGNDWEGGASCLWCGWKEQGVEVGRLLGFLNNENL